MKYPHVLNVTGSSLHLEVEPTRRLIDVLRNDARHGRRCSGAGSDAGQLAAAAADPEDDVRGSSAYKRELIKVLLGRCLRLAIADAQSFRSC